MADITKRGWLGGDELKANDEATWFSQTFASRRNLNLPGRDKPCSAILPACSTNVSTNRLVKQRSELSIASVCTTTP